MIKIKAKKIFHTIKQFQILENQILGNGSFGVVKLAYHKITNKLYAIKIISIDDIPSELQIKLIERQINIHLTLDHPHIIKLWDTLIENSFIYMIMDYAENGNLFYFQNKRNIFTESEAFRFFAQTAQGLQSMHSEDYFHRDIKPENLLLDHHYNIKICDLGWAAQNITQKRNTFCGTYEYMAPQMIFNKSYDYRIDLWALGVFLYELLHGIAPFKGQNSEQVQKNMLKGAYSINFKLSASVRDLINNLLKFNPEERLSIQQIFAHPWMKKTEKIIHNILSHNTQPLNPKNFHEKLNQVSLKKHKNQKQIQKKQFIKKSNNSTIQQFHHEKHSQHESKEVNINLSINNYSLPKNYKEIETPKKSIIRKKKQSEKKYQTLIEESVKKYIGNNPRQNPFMKYLHKEKKKISKKQIYPHRKSQQIKLDNKLLIRYNTQCNQNFGGNGGKQNTQKLKNILFNKMIGSAKNLLKTNNNKRQKTQMEVINIQLFDIFYNNNKGQQLFNRSLIIVLLGNQQFFLNNQAFVHLCITQLYFHYNFLLSNC